MAFFQKKYNIQDLCLHTASKIYNTILTWLSERLYLRNVGGRDDTIYCPTSRSTFGFIVVGEPKRILGLTPARQITILGGTYLVPHYIPPLSISLVGVCRRTSRIKDRLVKKKYNLKLVS